MEPVEDAHPQEIHPVDRAEPEANGEITHGGAGPTSLAAFAVAKPKGDESVGGVIGGETHLDPVPGNHADPEAAHSARELRGHRLPRLEGDLVAAAAEDLFDAAGRLDQIVSRPSGSL